MDAEVWYMAAGRHRTSTGRVQEKQLSFIPPPPLFVCTASRHEDRGALIQRIERIRGNYNSQFIALEKFEPQADEPISHSLKVWDQEKSRETFNGNQYCQLPPPHK